MKTLILSLVTLGFFVLGGTVYANPPMKTLYSKSMSTNFKWHWPYQTVKVSNYLQTKPYFYTGRLLNIVTSEDVSKYRFYYRQNVCKNEWGYFFPKGTKLCPVNLVNFPHVQPEDMVNRIILPKLP